MTTRATVIKLGGSVLTDKLRPDSFRHDVFERLAQELCRVPGLVLVHGTGAYGKPIAHAWGYPSGYIPPQNPYLWVRVRNHLALLHQQVLEVLVETAIPAVSVPVGTSIVCDGGRIVEGDALIGTMCRLLQTGVVPVLMGDVAPDVRSGFSVCSSDEIARYVAVRLSARRAVFLTDVDGVYGEWPPAAGSSPIEVLTRKSAVSVTGSSRDADDVSKAMGGKLGAALQLAEAGIPCSIHNGLRRGLLTNLLAGKSVPGTLIVPD